MCNHKQNSIDLNLPYVNTQGVFFNFYWAMV